jgi:uncharacterized membrane protein (Fun14 family)
LRDARTQAPPRYLKGACLISAAAALGFAAYEIAVAVKLWRVLPVDDQWETVTIYQDWVAGTLSPARLLAQHNEHRLPLTRLAFLVDFGLFRGRSTFVHALLLLSHIGLGAALGLVAAHGRTAVERVLAIAAGIAFLVSPIQLQNLTAPFNLQWAACGLFALGAFFWTARLAAARPDIVDRPTVIALAAIATVLAVYSSANGLTAALIVLVAALVLRVGRTARLVLPATAILAIASYLVGYGAPPYHQPFHAALRSSHGVAQFLIYMPALLGSIAQRFGLAACVILGIAGLGLWCVLVRTTLRRLRCGQAPDAGTTAMLMLAAMSIATAAMCAFGRASLGTEQALSSRYATTAILFWAGLAAAVWRLADATGQEARVRMAIIGVGVWLLVLSYLSAASIVGNFTARAALVDSITEELRSGRFDPEHVVEIFRPGAEFIRPHIEFLRARRLSIFAE